MQRCDFVDKIRRYGSSKSLVEVRRMWQSLLKTGLGYTVGGKTEDGSSLNADRIVWEPSSAAR